MSENERLSRRAVLCGACTGAALLSFAGAGNMRSEAATKKYTKQQVAYQDKPMDIRMCATCTFFAAPKSCQIVEGDVSRTGWCNAFSQVD